jgi:hypothetical protein
MVAALKAYIKLPVSCATHQCADDSVALVLRDHVVLERCVLSMFERDAPR